MLKYAQNEFECCCFMPNPAPTIFSNAWLAAGRGPALAPRSSLSVVAEDQVRLRARHPSGHGDPPRTMNTP